MLALGFTPSVEAYCGDGILEPTEVCDSTPGCSPTCQLETASCIDDVTGVTNNCTANDVRLALIINSTGDLYCEAGGTIDVDLIGELVAGASERWDIGVFVALDGGTARTGYCYHDFLYPATCGTYNPGSLTFNPDGTIDTFVDGGPYYNGECSEDPADVCGDLEQGVYNYRALQPLTIPCVDSNGDGKVDIGNCVSWDNQRSKGTPQAPSCLSVRDTVPNTKAKCRCETMNIANVYVAGKIIVDKVTVPAGDEQLFDFQASWEGDGSETFDFQLADASDPYDSGSLVPTGINGAGTYSISELTPEGWDLVDVTCTGSGGDDEDPAAIDLGSGETVTCVFTNALLGVDVTKTCDSLSKVGDDVAYGVTVTNTSGAGASDLECTVSDSLLGDLLDPANPYVTSTTCPADGVFAAGDSCEVALSRTVADTDGDPLDNTVTVECTFVGEATVVASGEESCSTDLFQPAVSIVKDGDTLSKVGDDASYTFTVTNDSSETTPELTCSITDSLLGPVGDPFTLALGATHTETASRTVAEGDPDPLVNTATVNCTVGGDFGNEISADSEEHSVDLFQPAVSIVKSGDTLSKVGDDVSYTFTVTNDSSEATPELTCSITDSLLGPVGDPFTLALGATHTETASRTVAEGDPDPLVNTATVNCTVGGDFGNEISADSEEHSVDLFQPAVSIVKSGDTLSKVGDDVSYTFTVTNDSSEATPVLTCSISDSLLGTVGEPFTLAVGGTHTETASRTVAEGDPDPLVNTATVNCTVGGDFGNEISAESNQHSVDLFQAAIAVAKTGDESSKVGDDVNYVITLSNNSSADSPALSCTATDTLLGEVFNGVLPPGDTVVNSSYTVQGGDPDPLTNTVTLRCSPEGYPNTLEESASHTTDLFQPSIEFSKTGDALSKIGDDVDYTFVLDNTSSAETPSLNCTITDAAIGVNEFVTLASGTSYSFTFTATVPAGAGDPFTNTAEVSCEIPGFPNVLTASASHSVNLFQPSITFDKSGDAAGKVGDVVAYLLTINNTSSADTPALECTITDEMLGINTSVTVASGASNVTPASYTVQEGDPDPLVNSASVSCSPIGFPNELTASDDHSVQLFQASITLDKTGDTLSKVGDDVSYTITLTNTSSGDTPDLECTISDPMLGSFGPYTIASGQNQVVNATYTVQQGDPDPLVNTATATCSPIGYPNVMTASGSHQVNLFQPSISVTKTGDDWSKAGDEILYNVVIENTSSTDSPALNLVSFTDSLVAGVVPPAACATLAPGDSCSFSYTYTVPIGETGSSLTNTASALYSPAGYPNQVTGSGPWLVTLVHPSFTVTKACTSQPVPQDGPATFDVVVTNTGDAPLDFSADDGIGTFSLGAGQSTTIQVSMPGPFDGQATVSNAVNVTASVGLPGLPNVLTGSAEAQCWVAGDATIIKLVQGQPHDSGSPWNFTIQDCGSDGCTSDSPVIGQVSSPPSQVNFGVDLVPYQLDPNQVYRLCEALIPAGWTNMWMGDLDDDGTPETVIPFAAAVSDDPVSVPPGWSRVFDPLYAPPPAIWDNSERCVNFVADAGQTEVFQIDNQYPGGEPRTIGYWKNWNSCTGGGQVQTAIDNGGETPEERVANGYALLDDVLYSPGIHLGDLFLTADDDVFDCDDGTQLATLILDKRDINNKKRASDPAYALASQLLAALANTAAGAGVCQDAGDAMIAGQTLLDGIDFLADGEYFGKKVSEINGFTPQQANALASTLDLYNNGILCAP